MLWNEPLNWFVYWNGSLKNWLYPTSSHFHGLCFNVVGQRRIDTRVLEMAMSMLVTNQWVPMPLGFSDVCIQDQLIVCLVFIDWDSYINWVTIRQMNAIFTQTGTIWLVGWCFQSMYPPCLRQDCPHFSHIIEAAYVFVGFISVSFTFRVLQLCS